MAQNIGALVIFSLCWDTPHFEQAIGRAKHHVNNPETHHHFASTGKMVVLGSGSAREVDIKKRIKISVPTLKLPVKRVKALG